EYPRQMMLPQSHAQMLDRFVDEPLEFEPGSEFRYSNSGYYLLGMIIESASGVSYAEFLQQEIFEPVGMKETGYDRFGKVIKARARGYQMNGNEHVNAEYLDMSQPYAAGALYSTVEDLGKWDAALRARKLISKEGYEQMWSPEKNDYAYGWRVANTSGEVLQEHGGGINGFATHFARLPDRKVCVAVFCNVLPSEPGRVANDLLRIVRGEDVELPKKRKFVDVDTEVLKTYEGKYKLKQPPLTIEISLQDGHLVAQPEGQPPAQLKPLSETKFYVQVIDGEVTFVADNEGNITKLILKQNGREAEATRQP
ncbi:MAG: serine hydrolase, partial [Planctomycetota bacterium]